MVATHVMVAHMARGAGQAAIPTQGKPPEVLAGGDGQDSWTSWRVGARTKRDRPRAHRGKVREDLERVLEPDHIGVGQDEVEAELQDHVHDGDLAPQHRPPVIVAPREVHCAAAAPGNGGMLSIAAAFGQAHGDAQTITMCGQRRVIRVQPCALPTDHVWIHDELGGHLRTWTGPLTRCTRGATEHADTLRTGGQGALSGLSCSMERASKHGIARSVRKSAVYGSYTPIHMLFTCAGAPWSRVEGLTCCSQAGMSDFSNSHEDLHD